MFWEPRCGSEMCSCVSRPSMQSSPNWWRNTRSREEQSRPCTRRCWETPPPPAPCRSLRPSLHGWGLHPGRTKESERVWITPGSSKCLLSFFHLQGLSWKWLFGATAVAIGGVALSVVIAARNWAPSVDREWRLRATREKETDGASGRRGWRLSQISRFSSLCPRTLHDFKRLAVITDVGIFAAVVLEVCGHLRDDVPALPWFLCSWRLAIRTAGAVQKIPKQQLWCLMFLSF